MILPADGELKSLERPFDQSDGLLSVAAELHVVNDDDLVPDQQRMLQAVRLPAFFYL